MVDLSDLCGLPLLFDPETYDLRSAKAGWDLAEPGLRTLDDMRPVLMDPGCEGPDVVYWMYRDLHLPEHAHMRREFGLRYDISVFRGDLFGPEYFKTAGHYHPYIHWQRPISWPEVYEVLYGEAIYVLQEVDDIYLDPYYIKVEDFVIVHAKPGRQVVMPPDYGHVTINPVPGGPLVMANWVCDWFKSYYKSVEEARGYGWYRIVGDDGEPCWVPNGTYKQPLPAVREAKAVDAPALGLTEGRPMYREAVADPARFEWVCRPMDYLKPIWESLELI
jgi:glucose-6-phosphate isomerase